MVQVSCTLPSDEEAAKAESGTGITHMIMKIQKPQSNISNSSEHPESNLYLESYLKIQRKDRELRFLTILWLKVPSWHFRRFLINLKMYEYIGLTSTALIKD